MSPLPVQLGFNLDIWKYLKIDRNVRNNALVNILKVPKNSFWRKSAKNAFEPHSDILDFKTNCQSYEIGVFINNTA